MKKVFLKTAVLTLIVLIIGFYLGIWFDNLRTEEVKREIIEIDLMWNDARLQSLYHQTFSDDSEFCKSALEGNLRFSEEIYQEGQKIENYERINRFSSELLLEKKRYALLQLQFWFNSINLREICNLNYSTVVYLYSHYDENLKINQKIQSVALLELKEKHGPDMMLIPLPVDMGILTMDSIKLKYNITKIPVVIVNEKYKFEGLTSKEEIEKVLFTP